ncbi:hypothetical protein ONZ43_g2344 [Nemania bipapillata]|uniref:Uncharacterized protein n=1 Tax=Nemania bipapillata TaxID=110536 RepID=A0ACC2J149_9PEZI|nr:hypothetical protein ONZ43_g2344 [Nemania bipapillata]
MHSSRRDNQVTEALKRAGYQLSTADLRRALTPMFRIATPIFVIARLEGKDLWDMLPEEKKPMPPFFDHKNNPPLVVEIVRFRKAVGDCPQEGSLDHPDYKSWILVDADIYNILAGGLDMEIDIDEDEEDEDMGERDERNHLIESMQEMTLETPNN